MRGGDRLPWVEHVSANGADNFAPLTSLDWQVHVYGVAKPDIQVLCAERQLRLVAIPWQPSMKRAGFRQDALYLVRPDGYVGLAATGQSAAALASYLDTRRIR